MTSRDMVVMQGVVEEVTISAALTAHDYDLCIVMAVVR